MVKYFIYAVFHESIEWKITTNISIDRRYWHEKGCQYLLFIDKPFTIGQITKIIACLQENKTVRKQQMNEENIFEIMRSCKTNVNKDNIITLPTIPGFQQYMKNYISAKQLFLQYLAGKLLLFEEFITYVKQAYNNFKTNDLFNILQTGYLAKDIKLSAGVSRQEQKKRLGCNRCGSMEDIYIEELSNRQESCAVCTNCIELGKSSSCTPLLHFIAERMEVEKTSIPTIELVEVSLTSYQEQVSVQLIDFLKNSRKKEILIWAVTGSGKTEMVFPAIEHGLLQGKKILFASPRKDVIKDLMPRFVKGFPNIQMISLYGGSADKWKHGQLYLATTHQVIRFEAFFDLIIIDEIDAFPYRNNKMLNDGVDRALKTNGQMVYLTATPSSDWLEQMRSGKIDYTILPIRYHGHLLPEPYFEMMPSKNKLLKSRKPFQPIAEFVNQVKGVNGQAFIFVPNIRDIRVWTKVLKLWFPGDRIDGVYAADPLRDYKVNRFKADKLQFLITTTIMERGVTVKNLHILVINAESAVFDAAALIQISGRAGRNADYPEGIVWFLAEYNTNAIKTARRQIKEMNKLAKKLSNRKVRINDISN